MSSILPPSGTEIFSNCTSLPLPGLELSSQDPRVALVGGICESPLGYLYTVPKPPGYIMGEQLVRLINWIGESLSQFTPSKLSERFKSLQTTLSPYPVTLLLQNIAGYKQGISSQILFVMNMMQLTAVAAEKVIDSGSGDAIVDRENDAEVELIFSQGCYNKGEGPLSQSTLEQGFALDREGQRLYQMKKYAEAIVNFHKATEVYKSMNWKDKGLGLTFGACLNNLGLCYLFQGNNEKAMEMLKWSLTVRVESVGEYHESIADSLTNIGLCFIAQGKHEEASELYQGATRVKRKILKNSDPSLGVSLINEGANLCILGEFEQAKTRYKEAEQIFSLNGNTQAAKEASDAFESCKAQFKDMKNIRRCAKSNG